MVCVFVCVCVCVCVWRAYVFYVFIVGSDRPLYYVLNIN